MPRRIQRRRTKGWRMPKGAVYVGRPTKWGNPYIETGRPGSRRLVVQMFRVWVMAPERASLRDAARQELRGRPLCCWCGLDQECHADVWLEIANS